MIRFDEDIRRYMEEILHSRNRSEAIFFRSNALQFLDQWRLQRIEQLDQRVRTAGQLILNAFDQYQSTLNSTKGISSRALPIFQINDNVRNVHIDSNNHRFTMYWIKQLKKSKFRSVDRNHLHCRIKLFR